MTDIKDRAREYLRLQTQLNGGGLFHCNILNLMLGFAEQETKELEKDKQYFSDSLDKQIEATLKLDKENAELTRINDNLEKDRLAHIELEDKLRKENAELDCQKNRNKYCYSCANATERCFRNEIGCPCDNYKSYKDENEELRNNGFTVSAMTEQQLKVALEKGEQLEKENAELKEKNKALDKDLFEAEKCIHWLGVKDDQLTKAKEIIKAFLDSSDLNIKHKAEEFLGEF